MALFGSRTFWLSLLVVSAAYGISWALRYYYVEPSSAALACNSLPHPNWCQIRFAILAGQHNSLFGVIATITGVAALLRGGRGLAIAAAGLAVVAIVNYNVEMGALALVFGLIASVSRKPLPARHDGAPRA